MDKIYSQTELNLAVQRATKDLKEQVLYLNHVIIQLQEKEAKEEKEKKEKKDATDNNR